MSKALLLSVILASIVLPAIAAGEKSPRKGLKKTITFIVLFNAFYFFYLTYLFGRI